MRFFSARKACLALAAIIAISAATAQIVKAPNPSPSRPHTVPPHIIFMHAAHRQQDKWPISTRGVGRVIQVARVTSSPRGVGSVIEVVRVTSPAANSAFPGIVPPASPLPYGPLSYGAPQDWTLPFLFVPLLGIVLLTWRRSRSSTAAPPRRTSFVSYRQRHPSRFVSLTILSLLLFAVSALIETVMVHKLGLEGITWAPLTGQPLQLVGVGLCILALFIAVRRRAPFAAQLGLACVITGAFASLFAALCYHGYVPDFINPPIPLLWPTLTPADISVVVGLAIALIGTGRAVSPGHST